MSYKRVDVEIENWGKVTFFQGSSNNKWGWEIGPTLFSAEFIQAIADKLNEMNSSIEFMKFKYKETYLTCNWPIEGLTQDLMSDPDGANLIRIYGNQYFICELDSEEIARKIAGMIIQTQPNLPANCPFEIE